MSRLLCGCVALVAGCTATPTPGPDASCSPLPNLVTLSPGEFSVQSGIHSETTVLSQGTPLEILDALRTKRHEGDLRRACSGEPDVLLPDDDVPVENVLAALPEIILPDSGVVRIPVGGEKTPLRVLGLRFRLPPADATDRPPPRCSRVSVDVEPDRIHLSRYPQLTNNGFGARLSFEPSPATALSLDSPAAASEPPVSIGYPSISHVYTGPDRLSELLQALKAPHFGLPNCEVVGVRFRGALQWAPALEILEALDETLSLQLLLH
ncbi:MAG: hypothetical protein ACRBN8_02255 [Nannocystales bacterium]